MDREDKTDNTTTTKIIPGSGRIVRHYTPERSILGPEHSFVAVREVKVHPGSPNNRNQAHEAKVRPIKNARMPTTSFKRTKI